MNYSKLDTVEQNEERVECKDGNQKVSRVVTDTRDVSDATTG